MLTRQILFIGMTLCFITLNSAISHPQDTSETPVQPAKAGEQQRTEKAEDPAKTEVKKTFSELETQIKDAKDWSWDNCMSWGQHPIVEKVILPSHNRRVSITDTSIIVQEITWKQISKVTIENRKVEGDVEILSGTGFKYSAFGVKKPVRIQIKRNIKDSRTVVTVAHQIEHKESSQGFDGWQIDRFDNKGNFLGIFIATKMYPQGELQKVRMASYLTCGIDQAGEPVRAGQTGRENLMELDEHPFPPIAPTAPLPMATERDYLKSEGQRSFGEYSVEYRKKYPQLHAQYLEALNASNALRKQYPTPKDYVKSPHYEARIALIQSIVPEVLKNN